MSKVRCAIYTRKSSEEGLEQDFNSLDAQYEACKAYIASQKHEGWSLVRERYDDGGFSGGSMNRPGLTQLLADISAGKVDVVIIYKIDRLTRSLADFARIIERLDQAGASFVSVTQSFNTKTSMGRLMLHVLLSFAQFEREVGAERVRDKIAASKAKGMWMGGTVPLGYDARDRKLQVNAQEAQVVSALFARFVEVKSVAATLRWAEEQGLRTKKRIKLERQAGGARFTYGSLRAVLANRLYAGDVCHKGNIYPGQHAAIIERGLFDEAQTILSSLGSEAARGEKQVSGSILQGIVIDCHGRTMGPVHTTRSGQRYRYYATHPKAIAGAGPAAYRLAADALEQRTLALLAEHLKAQIDSVEGDARARSIAETLMDGEQPARRHLLREHLSRVIVGDGTLTLELTDGQRIERSVQRTRHGNDARLVVGDLRPTIASAADTQLLILLKDAYRARALALAKPKLDLEQLAVRFGRSTERFKRLLRLSYLSPKVIDHIVAGQQPRHVTNRFLQNLDGLPPSWSEQEKALLS